MRHLSSLPVLGGGGHATRTNPHCTSWLILGSLESTLRRSLCPIFSPTLLPAAEPMNTFPEIPQISRTSGSTMSWGRLLALVLPPCVIYVESALAATLYGQTPLWFTRTTAGPAPPYTGLPAYNPTILTPHVVNPASGPYSLELTNNVSAITDVSIPVNGIFNRISSCGPNR